MDFVKTWAKEQGYAIVISRSRANRLWLKCDRGGHYENRRNISDDQRKRKRGHSRLMGCPFLVIAILKDDIWRTKTEMAQHNHGPSEDLTAHPSLRKMTKEQISHLESMTDAGKTPAEIMDEMKAQWPDINIVKRDIYNARKKHKDNKRDALAASPAEEPHWEDPNGVVPGPTPTGKWVWAEEGDELVAKGKKKRKKVYVPAPQPTVDPQLDNPHQSPPQQSQSYADDGMAAQMAFQGFAQPFDDASSMHLQPGDYTPNRHHSAPNPLQQLSGLDSATDLTDPTTDNASFFTQQAPQRNSLPNITGPRIQQQQQSRQTLVSPRANHKSGAMTASPPNTRSAAAAAAASATNQLSGLGPYAPTAAATTTTTTTAGQAASSSSRNHNGQILMKRMERMEKEQSDQKRMLSQILGAVTGQMTDT